MPNTGEHAHLWNVCARTYTDGCSATIVIGDLDLAGADKTAAEVIALGGYVFMTSDALEFP